MQKRSKAIKVKGTYMKKTIALITILAVLLCSCTVKITKNEDISQKDAETEDMGPLISALEERIGQLGGYIENREVYNGSTYAQRRYRRADLTIRIPADKVDGFVDHVGDLSNIVSSSDSVGDILLE